jgi:hypothetical protein
MQRIHMKSILALPVAMLLFVSATCTAATVTYQYPDLTIVAKEEPLDSVLKSLGKEMRIYVTIPTSLSPVVNCDIQQQPVKEAFKTLLGDVSYSLEWDEKTGQLVGVTILAGGEGTAVATVSDRSTHNESVEQAASVPVVSSGGLEARPPVAQSDVAVAAHQAQIEAEEQEAQEERLKEDVERHDTEMAAYLQSLGPELSQ